jgi:hypothetical protein
VSLVDLFGTLTELCGLPPKADIESRSLARSCAIPQAEWPHAAITHLDKPENYALSTERWRYIHYTRWRRRRALRPRNRSPRVDQPRHEARARRQAR